MNPMNGAIATTNLIPRKLDRKSVDNIHISKELIANNQGLCGIQHVSRLSTWHWLFSGMGLPHKVHG